MLSKGLTAAINGLSDGVVTKFPNRLFDSKELSDEVTVEVIVANADICVLCVKTELSLEPKRLKDLIAMIIPFHIFIFLLLLLLARLSFKELCSECKR